MNTASYTITIMIDMILLLMIMIMISNRSPAQFAGFNEVKKIR
jgi:hypothetical protein